MFNTGGPLLSRSSSHRGVTQESYKHPKTIERHGRPQGYRGASKAGKIILGKNLILGTAENKSRSR